MRSHFFVRRAIFPVERPRMVHPMTRATHMNMNTLNQTFLASHTKKVSFNQAVFSGCKIIPQTSKPGSDTNMAPGPHFW